MFPFPQSVTPAVRNHMDAHAAFLNDMSKTVFHSFQQMCDLNIQLVQTLVEEGTVAGQQVLKADRQTEIFTAASIRAQPTSEKLRAYQQHFAKLAADSQAELARVTEQHVQNTSRTARALVDEVARTSAEETERSIRTQQEALRSAADPFARPNDAAEPAMRGDGEEPRGHPVAGQGAQQGQGGRPSGSAAH
ncbi:phasin family protein [Telluria aromaticivorans]|uniref:TIGR01841 family phasin n=1 Tax=Telluria aromaticivorans TaxID=2725995 RepID=A0A7Y2JWG5_9BURK|nr:phasin family protein [Telluria aromaticivorans]NNG22160.1 TIGR01841 family phasin [Telluria aromaticivorans]